MAFSSRVPFTVPYQIYAYAKNAGNMSDIGLGTRQPNARYVQYEKHNAHPHSYNQLYYMPPSNKGQ